MDGVSLDQLQVFVTVVERGSFSAAARKLGRAQSAITYAIQKLEDQVGAELFDRAAYRPSLSDAGRILLPHARRVLDDMGHFRASARQITRGLEAELRIVIAAMIPMVVLTPALAEFAEAFPTVQLRLSVLPFSMATGHDMPGLSPGIADLRILYDLLLPESLAYGLIAKDELVTVAAASHPLARVAAGLDEHALRDHLQVLLSEPEEAVPGEDKRVAALNIWRVTDPAALHALIRSGIGWGSLPASLAREDLLTGRLIQLGADARSRFRQLSPIGFVVAHRRDEPLGPAGGWLFDRLSRQMTSP